MNNIHNKMEEIKKEFSIFEDERDKYIYLVDIAKNLLELILLNEMMKIKYMDVPLKLG